jgi:hypothetical protein
MEADHMDGRRFSNPDFAESLKKIVQS